MIGDRDSGVSVVIAFVTILAIIAIAVGMWALLGIPGQIREANEAHAVAVTDAMIDYKVMLDNLHEDNFTSLNVSVLLPVGSSVSSFSSGQIALKSETAGTLSLVKNGYEPVWSQDVNRFVLTTGTAEIGYEGGGVYRGDKGKYVWSVYPQFSIFNSSKELLIEFKDVSNITGEFALGTSGDVAVNTRYESMNYGDANIMGNVAKDDKGDDTGSEENFTIKYTSTLLVGAEEDADLWYSLFYEEYSKYLLSGKFHDDNLSVGEPMINPAEKSVTMMVHSYDIKASAVCNGFTYSAGLVPDYIVKEAADIVVDGVGYNYNKKKTEADVAEIIESINIGDTITFEKGCVYQLNGFDWVCVIINGETKINKGGNAEFTAATLEAFFNNPNNEFVKIDKKSVYHASDITTDSKWSSIPSKGSLYSDIDNAGNNIIYVCNGVGSDSDIQIKEPNWIKIVYTE